MYNGKLTFSTPSTHPKKNAKYWREKNVSDKHILQEKNSWQMNGLKKINLQQTTQPFPPGTLRSKVVAWPLTVLRPLKLWRELLWFDSCKEPPPVSNQLILSFWLLSYVKFDCSTSKLISHIKTGSACLSTFLPIHYAKRTCIQTSTRFPLI